MATAHRPPYTWYTSGHTRPHRYRSYYLASGVGDAALGGTGEVAADGAGVGTGEEVVEGVGDARPGEPGDAMSEGPGEMGVGEKGADTAVPNGVAPDAAEEMGVAEPRERTEDRGVPTLAGGAAAPDAAASEAEGPSVRTEEMGVPTLEPGEVAPAASGLLRAAGAVSMAREAGAFRLGEVREVAAVERVM